MPEEDEGYGLLDYQRDLAEKAGKVEPRIGPGAAPKPGGMPPPAVIPGRRRRKEYQENCHFSCHPFDWIPVDVYNPDGTEIPGVA